MSKKSQTTKSPLIEQAIARARTMKPAARAEFLRRHSAAEVAEIHTALVGEAKPKTPRPILEKRILHALAENTPPPAHLDQDMNILVAEHHAAIDAAREDSAAAPAESKPLDEALATSATAAANAATWDSALPEPGYVPPAGTGEEPATAEGAESDHEQAEDAASTGADVDASEPAGETGAKDDATAAAPTGRAPRERDARLPAVGTVIVKRDRHGAERVRCTIREGGVEYGGTTYKSISSAAMAAAKDLGLASKTQDGYSFWCLKKATGLGTTKKDALSALQKASDRYFETARAAVANAVNADAKAHLHEVLGGHAKQLQALVGEAVA